MSANTPKIAWRRLFTTQGTRDERFLLTGSVYARSGTNTVLVLALFVLAAMPALVVSAWSAGHKLLLRQAEGLSGWRAQVLEASGRQLSTDDWLSTLTIGLSEVLPLLVTACAVSLFWAALFAKVRRRPIDPGWLMTGMIYVLLLPADISPLLAGLGMTFAAVLGQHIFGGTGRYVVSPAVLGAVFIQFSYPGIGTLSNAASWAAATTANSASHDFAVALSLVCIIGAVLLARVGAASWRTLAGGVLGVGLGAVVAGAGNNDALDQVPWFWHLALGNAPICLAFVITDPTTSPLTRGGRWLHGLLFGILLVAIRVLDPTHPEGSLFAVLLATLCVPLVDYLIIRRRVARTQGVLKCRT